MQGTQAVIEACTAAGVRKLVFTSSVTVVFDGTDLIDVDERLPVTESLEDHYVATKVRFGACGEPEEAGANASSAGQGGAFGAGGERQGRAPHLLPPPRRHLRVRAPLSPTQQANSSALTAQETAK